MVLSVYVKRRGEKKKKKRGPSEKASHPYADAQRGGKKPTTRSDKKEEKGGVAPLLQGPRSLREKKPYKFPQNKKKRSGRFVLRRLEGGNFDIRQARQGKKKKGGKREMRAGKSWEKVTKTYQTRGKRCKKRPSTTPSHP